MEPGRWNFTIYEGADFDRVLTWKNPDGSPVDLGGWSAILQVRTAVDQDALVSLTSAPGGGITLGGVAGTITLHMPAAVTKLLTFKKALHNLVLTAPGGAVTRLLEGQVSLSRAIAE